MTTVQYFWHGFIHKGTTFIYPQYSPPLFITFCKMFGKHRTTSARPSLLMFPIDCPIAWISSSLVLYFVPRSGSFTLAKIVITLTHITWVWWMFQNLPLSAGQEVRDNSSGVIPCIVVKNDGVLYHQVSLFSLERGAILPPSCSYTTMNITFTTHSIGHTFFGGGELGCFHSFDWSFSWFIWDSPGFVDSDDLSEKVITFSLVPVEQGLCDCIAVPLLHLRNFMG